MSKSKGFVPMKVTAGWIVGFVARDMGRTPTAQELADYTRQHADLWSEPWSVEQAQFALDNPGHVVNPDEAEGE